MTLEEKSSKLSEIIPTMCNVVTGFIGPTGSLYVTTVGILTPDGIAALPPFIGVDNIVEHYWKSIVDDGATVVIDAGKPEQRAYAYKHGKWEQDSSIPNFAPEKSPEKPTIMRLTD